MSDIQIEGGSGLNVLADIHTSQMIGAHLEKHYPNWAWRVRADSDQGIVRIASMYLSGKYGVILKFSSFENDPSLKAVTQHCGEMLERFGFKRGPCDPVALETRKQFLGEYGFDHHGMANGKASASIRIGFDHFRN